MRSVSAFRAVGAAVYVLALAGSASAATLNASAAQGGLAASASFAVSGSNLVITLTNTSAADVLVPANVLTGVYFDISGAPLALSRASVILAAGSMVINTAVQPAGGVVGGEFGYRGDLSGAPYGASYGVSSSGLGLFGPPDLFPGANLDGPSSPDGLQYGITSAGDNPATGNGGTNTPLIKSAVVITLGGLPAGFDPAARISNISFQYGTSLDEPNLLVPSPAAAALLGLAGLARRRRRSH